MGGFTRRGSGLSLNQDHNNSPSLEDSSKVQSLRGSFRTGTNHWHHYLSLACLAITFLVSERLEPFRHVLYTASDEELWRYSYPMKANQVTPMGVVSIGTLVPLALIVGWRLSGKITDAEAHHAAMAALSCVLTTGIMTNFIKVQVARFRPNFVARCWPQGAPQFLLDGTPNCDATANNPTEGMKSFPSGHTSWSSAGLGFSSLFLIGKLRCFADGGFGSSLAFIVSILPLSGAVWIGASRLQDYWHHVEDVAFGGLLGFIMAFCFYRTVYCGVLSAEAGCLVGGTALVHVSGPSNRKRGAESSNSSADMNDRLDIAKV